MPLAMLGSKSKSNLGVLEHQGFKGQCKLLNLVKLSPETNLKPETN